MNKKSNIKNYLMAFGIGVLLVFFIGYGLNLFYKPDLKECIYKTIEVDESKCQFEMRPIEQSNSDKVYCWKQDDKTLTEDSAYKSCLDSNQKAQKTHSTNTFSILMVLGIIFIIVGVLIHSIPSLSGGLMLGGILSLIWGITRYWSYMGDYLKFGVIGAGLIVLIGLAIWKLKD